MYNIRPKKLIAKIIIVGLIAVITTGCESQYNSLDTDKSMVNEEITLVSGYVSEKYSQYKNNEETLNIIVKDEDTQKELIVNNTTFDEIEEGNYYIIAYEKDTDLVIKASKKEVVEKVVQTPDIRLIKSVQEISNNPEEYISGIEEMNLVEEFNIDINEDSLDDHIQLYTSAELDEQGNIINDDGQYEVLRLKISTEQGYLDFVLIDEYVQLGKIRLHIYKDTSGIKLTVVDSRTANFIVKTYTYNGSEIEEDIRVIDDSEDVIMLYESN